MKIEILKTGKMTNSGQAVLRSLQNNSLPYLDLLIRESIQNSLDAYKENSTYVNVDFITGNFDGKLLDKRLEKVNFMEKVKTDYYKYIAIQDKNTYGLTGPLSHKEMEGDDYGNLVKLVYELAKPQTNEGSGGSWGYGKSIYYGVGIGLVLFYSRIEIDGEYQERLAAAYIEDETNNPILPPAQGTKTRLGIAWWGNDAGDGSTEAVTDPKLIHEYMSIFNIKPYENEETGTTIIIPFINEKELLRHSYGSLQGNDHYYESIEHYLEVAVQRWYAPRLVEEYANVYERPYLKSRVNDINVLEQAEKFFSIVQDLYKYALNSNNKPKNIECNRENIKYYQNRTDQFKANKNLGTLIYTKVNYKDLGMGDIYNPNNPHFLSGKAERHESEKHSNKPIITFTRLPGMLVSYEEHGDWANNIEETDIEEYIIGIFVLNSFENVYLNGFQAFDLNEYVRKGEKADHTTWDDPRMDDSTSNRPYELVKVLKRKVRHTIAKEYKTHIEVDSRISRNSSQISKELSDKILPSYGFGKKASKKRKTTVRSVKPPTQTVRNSKKLGYTILDDLVKIKGNTVTVPIQLSIKDLQSFELNVLLRSGNDAITLEKYEKDTGNKAPFEIKFSKLIDNLADLIDEKLYNVENKSSNKNTNFGQIFKLNEEFTEDSFMLVVVLETDDIRTIPVLRIKEGV